jgi:Fur family ferric uptake transcriptional regulator
MPNSDDRKLPVGVLGLVETKTHRKREPYSPTAAKRILRDLGVKVTDQRLAMLEVLMESDKHFTAQEVFDWVTESRKGVGFATVFRFLRQMTERGFLVEVKVGGLPARYEWQDRKHHDHLTCLKCGKIFEFHSREIESLQEKVSKSLGFKLAGHLLELYGDCLDANCGNLKSGGQKS